MSTHNIPFPNMKKGNHPKLSQICSYEICSKGPKNEFETVVVNGPSVFETLKFYCIFTEISRVTQKNALRFCEQRRLKPVVFVFCL